MFGVTTGRRIPGLQVGRGQEGTTGTAGGGSSIGFRLRLEGERKLALSFRGEGSGDGEGVTEGGTGVEEELS